MAGGGVCQMSIFLNKPYLLKWSTKVDGSQKLPKTVSMVYERPLKGVRSSTLKMIF